ncbi:MAG TPA: TetR/AcrR family transcriptional regulator [Kineosporiaceae bacterium]
MTQPVNKRRYDSTRRRASAERTRAAVLLAARDLFTRHGYAATPVTDIARAAGVSLDTVYAAVGRKPQLLLAVHDMELAEGGTPVDAEQRDYVQQIRAAPTAAEKISTYAAALARVLPRTVPLALALRAAGETDPACREAYAGLTERRAANMRLFAQDLRGTGELRDDLDDAAVGDLIWTMNSPDYYTLVLSRGRTPQEYADLVQDVWTRTLLQNPSTARPAHPDRGHAP